MEKTIKNPLMGLFVKALCFSIVGQRPHNCCCSFHKLMCIVKQAVEGIYLPALLECENVMACRTM